MSDAADSEDGVDSNKGPVLLSVSVTTTAFAVLMCGVRFLVRHRLDQKLRWDDYSIIGAMIMGFIGTVFTILEGSSTKDAARAAQFNFLSQPWLMMASTLAKISACLYFLRTIGRRLRLWNLALAGLVGVMVVISLVVTLLLNLQCRPVKMIWDPSVDGECFDAVAGLNAGFLSGGFEIFSFLFLAFFSMLVVVRSTESFHNIRWPFYALSISSLVAGILCIIRTHEISAGGVRRGYAPNSSTITLLGVLIQNIGISAANILPLASFLTRHDEQISLGSSSDTELADRGSAKETLSMGAKQPSGFSARGTRPGRDHLTRKPAKIHLKFARRMHSGGIGETKLCTIGEAGNEAAPVKMAIVKTTTVEIIEEDVADAGRTPTRPYRKAHAKVKTATAEDWKHILKGTERQ